MVTGHSPRSENELYAGRTHLSTPPAPPTRTRARHTRARAGARHRGGIGQASLAASYGPGTMVVTRCFQLQFSYSDLG